MGVVIKSQSWKMCLCHAVQMWHLLLTGPKGLLGDRVGIILSSSSSKNTASVLSCLFGSGIETTCLFTLV
jgi:hypothetical protein